MTPALYWISLLLFGSFLLVNLTLGVIYTEFLEVQVRDKLDQERAWARLHRAETAVRVMVGKALLEETKAAPGRRSTDNRRRSSMGARTRARLLRRAPPRRMLTWAGGAHRPRGRAARCGGCGARS